MKNQTNNTNFLTNNKYVRTSGKLLSLYKNALNNNTDYVLSCQIANIRYCGNATLNFTTRKTTTISAFNFTISPANGTAYTTNFTFSVVKPTKNVTAANYSKCRFGYTDSKLNSFVGLNSDYDSKALSGANETFNTTLPATSDKSLIVFARCVDVNGIITQINRTVTLVNQTAAAIVLAENALNKTLNASTYLSLTQVVFYGNQLLSSQLVLKNYTVIAGYVKILDSISKLNV